MIPLSTALSARYLLVLLTVCFVLLVLVVLLLGHAHLGGIPVLAESTMGVIN